MKFLMDLFQKDTYLYQYFWYLILIILANISILTFNFSYNTRNFVISKREKEKAKEIIKVNPLFVNYIFPNALPVALFAEILCIGTLYLSSKHLSVEANIVTVIIFFLITIITGYIIPRYILKITIKIKEEIRTMEPSKYEDNEHSRGADSYELDIRKNIEPDEDADKKEKND